MRRARLESAYKALASPPPVLAATGQLVAVS